MKVNPLTHVVALVRDLMYEDRLSEVDFWVPSLTISVLVIIVSTVLFYVWALRICQRPNSGDLK